MMVNPKKSQGEDKMGSLLAQVMNGQICGEVGNSRGACSWTGTSTTKDPSAVQ